MFTMQTLEITGYQDAPVPHTFWRQDAATRHVAIVLPGLAYGCDLPLLYYPARLLVEMGADVLRVASTYHTDTAFRVLTQAEQAERLHADTLAACRVALDHRAYERVTLVGKSLGTVAMGQLLTTEARLAGAMAVWLTPLLRDDRLRAQVTQWGGRSLFVSGSADPHHDPAALAAVARATGGESIVVTGADHSLEIAGNVLQSLVALREVMQAVQRFLAQEQVLPDTLGDSRPE